MFAEFLCLFVLCLMTVRNYLVGASIGFPGGLLAFFLLAILLRERAERQRTDFLNQLKSHRKELRTGGTVSVDGLILRYETVVTFYVLSIGTLFININIPTQYRIMRGEAHPEGVIYSLVSLVTGWWSISGPHTTLAVVLGNLDGGKKKPISELIDHGLTDAAEAKSSPGKGSSHNSNQLKTHGK